MAERALKRVEDHLNCSICLDIYTDPKLLQCFHVYCRQCLVRLVDRDHEGQLFLPCPTCRQVTPVPQRGVAGLQAAFHINQLLEIVDTHKREGEAPSGAEGEGETPPGAERVEGPAGDAKVCSDHDGKELELYCETCGELVCLKCAIKGGKHHLHDYALVGELFDRSKEEIASSLEPVEKQLATAKEVLTQIDSRCGEISNQRVAVKADIHKTISRLHSALDTKCTELVGQLDRITQSKLKGLAAQRGQVETTVAQLESCVDFMKDTLLRDSQFEVVRVKDGIVKQVKEVTTPFQPDRLKPSVEADVVFSATVDVAALCCHHMKVYAPGLPDPSRCQVALGAEVAVGELYTARFQAVSFRDEPCEEHVDSLECELVSNLTDTVTKCSVERRGRSQYEISCHPAVRGRQDLHVRVFGEPVVGSPFSVGVNLPPRKLGTPLRSFRAERPWGVVVSKKGDVIVTEYGGHCVSVFSHDAKDVARFGSRGSNNGQFCHPCGVALDGAGDILVADCHNHRLEKFTLAGEFITSVGTPGRKPLQFHYPFGIAFNPANHKLYIVDSDRIHVLNPDLSFFKTFGKEGSGKGQFVCPWDVACDGNGKVYVADSRNCRVQVFTPEGVFLHLFGRHQNWGGLARPMCLAVGADGLVYVTDEINHRVSVFTSAGGLVAVFGRQGEKPGEFSAPRGLALDGSGMVYVCDRGNYRIQLF